MNNENKINLLIKKGQYYQKNHDYFRAYSNFKRAFKLSSDIKILFIMIDLTFHVQKSGLLVNQNIKYILLKNLIEYAFKINQNQKFFNQLFFYKLKFYREFKYFEKFKNLYESNKFLVLNDFLIQQEYFHYLLENNQYEEAEKVFAKLPFDKSEIYKLLKTFYLDKSSYSTIKKTKKIDLKFNQTKIKMIKKKFDYVILTSGSYKIFLYEMMNFLISLSKNSTNYLVVIYIHDANKTEKEHVKFAINNLGIDNYIFIFDKNPIRNISDVQIKAFYTANRYITAYDLLKKYKKPVYVFDGDCIIYKDLLTYMKLHKSFDICLSIKSILRYVWTFISAPHTIFYPTENTIKYLNFYENYVHYCIQNNLIRWHIDQVALYTSYVMLERFENKVKIHDNDEQNRLTDGSQYFKHMGHVYKI
ncbi:MAG: hypothetical protein CFH15_00711 [Alphaproteobacteria bacterium MarineAlpha5_Bin5]|nr:MAG: hypothetical protein CFH15_00711 [Alphaproteobacteria bacterium MarineAlpha5_Bin5]PPR50623.1 MAG: hypothetical protein CFH14_00852 [Alphaproteobacteria bacterium MarineAlpha5_Bin4]|tara:strand:+ start:41 stop:1291 length:1251 start_codon:yes stop_codon:yes gene_type:complete